MSLRRKIFLAITTASVMLTALAFGASRQILLNSYAQLENDAIRSSTNRVLNTIEAEQRQLSATAADWSYWDDTYTFMQSGDPAYIHNNLTDDTLVTLDINLILLLDNDRQLVYSKFVDLESGVETAAPFTLTADVIRLLVPHLSALEDERTGFIEIEGVPLLLSARHILNSHLEGPIRGTLIFGRYVNEQKIAEWSQQLDTTVALQRVEDSPIETRSTLLSNSENSGEQSFAIQHPNTETAVSFALLKDISGYPSHVLQINTRRTIYRQGLSSLRYFLASMILVGAISLGIVLLLADKFVLARIEAINQSVSRIRETGDLTVSVGIQGEDELANFARVLQEMLNEIAVSHGRLEKLNANLETLIAQRTQKLAQANQNLKAEIHERKQVEIQLATARDQALEALRFKSQVLANVSHDARTPLSAIMLYTQMLAQQSHGALNPKQLSTIKNISTNAQKMLTFVNSLLETSQSTLQTIELEYSSFSPKKLIKDVEAVMQPLATRKNLQLISSIDDHMPSTLTGDLNRLQQIVNNLVDNAIKFTQSGSVSVRVSNGDVNHWSIAVSDTGCGIPEEHLEHIFDPFWQIDGSGPRESENVQGVGLGLSIVKQLTNLMQGKIEVANNTPEPGATFKVTIPYHQMQDPEG